MNTADIPFLSTAALGRLIAQKEVSPVEVTEAYLRRIDDVDFKFNAYLTVCRTEAMVAAREAEQAILRGEYRGPLHGIPVAVKDQFWTKGIRSTGGSRILADFVPEEDATVITKLKQAGAVLLGKTNLTELAITGFSHRFSTPRNPWNLEMYTGGSSSGSGAATAAFLCATSLGEDTGGSIRFPANLVRPGGFQTQLGLGEPLRGDAWRLVHGYSRPYLAHGRGCGDHPGSHRWL
jgi:Asp-tRNA(Asn)/Glu-tRNA(Gln) amidotransferase A subunit family amidase